MKTLKVVEIFHSIQGEGGLSGKPMIFIRLAGCNENCPFCDTKWDEGTEMTLAEIIKELYKYPTGTMICWTGGEPTLQLTDGIVEYFSSWFQTIETNGTNEIPNGLDYITISPKDSSIQQLYDNIDADNFSVPDINEIRCVIGHDDSGVLHLPDANIFDIDADVYYVSPLFVGDPHVRSELNAANVQMAVDFVKNDPRWRLSLQIHKIINIP